ncbi:hypothetical protein [Pandoraea sp. SD6-2]|uniref:hypothetical protein n=1 Tax=Pandoraea sp. SD6-2 TaxID=1286093 RepID=UPI00032FD832|nr:hypothetical protein [Pandoraea sp. SD6-2]EON13109.1 hypothetical protein C266_13894 [Pandoraea sp. SD6-2]
MAKPVLSPEQFINEVNRRLPNMFGYKPGMKAFLVPDGADGAHATGYDCEPDDLATIGAVKAASDAVLREFDVNPYISRV